MKKSPSRIVHHQEALAWLAAQGVVANSSFITSMPDFSEFPTLQLDQWKHWFTAAAKAIMLATSDDGVSIFYQRDAKKDGAWVDKAYLIQKAAEELGQALLWHKIICRAPPGNITFGKPAYSHLLCFAKKIRVPLEKSTIDVVPVAGKVTWTRGMGINACVIACKFIQEHTSSNLVIDPFCGHGTVLAVANSMGLDSLGVELGRKRAEKAQLLKASLDPPRLYT